MKPLAPEFTQPLPTCEDGWQLILADPPWNYRSWAPANVERANRSADRHYRTMSIKEICEMPVRDIIASDAHLALWITGPHLDKFPLIMRAWGFRYSATAFVWMKLTRKCGDRQMRLIRLDEIMKLLHFGTGHTTRKNAEFCLLGRRGNARRMAKNVPEAILTPVREHSRKPDEAAERLVTYCGDVRRLELFARQSREGWETWGNERELFDQAA